MRTVHRVPAILVGLGLAACVTRGDIEEIKENQKTIIDKLDKGGRAPARPAQQRPRGPDRAATYAFPIGDATYRGPADAAVTLIEVTDFQ